MSRDGLLGEPVERRRNLGVGGDPAWSICGGASTLALALLAERLAHPLADDFGQGLGQAIDLAVDLAVQAAKTAYYDGRWSKRTPSERSKILWKLADLLEDVSDRDYLGGLVYIASGTKSKERGHGPHDS